MRATGSQIVRGGDVALMAWFSPSMSRQFASDRDPYQDIRWAIVHKSLAERRNCLKCYRDAAYTAIAPFSITNRRTEPPALRSMVAGTPAESHATVPELWLSDEPTMMHLPLPSARGAVHGPRPATLWKP